ncbi:MAG: phosphatidylinositol alpha-1,6-mannosyltransferase [Candidatus Latescibacterota bacterium]|jgi:phosphatidylinositol alpha-1,6-mannosyltransferase
MAPAAEGAETVDAELDCRVVRVPLRLEGGHFSKVYKSLQLLRAAWRFCRTNNVRAIHCGQVFSTGFAGYGCQFFLGVPYTVYVYGADLLEFRDRFFWSNALRRILKRATSVVAISEFTRRAVLQCGAVDEQVHIVRPALDLQRFTEPVDREAERATYEWTGHKVVLSIGRLVERKGQDMVIRALVEVAREVPEVLYAIGGSGPHRAELEKLASDLGVSDRVQFLGFVEEGELVQRYAAADVFSMVSREIGESGEVEGFGIVYLEANACATPVLGGRSGGVEDAIADGESGLLVDPNDVVELSSCLVRLLCDEALRMELGQNGRRRVFAEFDRRVQASRLWELSA